MRIVLVNHTFPPFSWAGSEACVYHTARFLRGMGHEVFVFYRYSDPADEEYCLVEETFEGIPVARINHTHRFSRRFERTYLNRAVAAIFGHWLGRVAPDLVHFHHLTNLSIDLPREAKWRGIATVMTLHDYWLLCQRGQLLTPALDRCDGPTSSGCRNCLAPQLLKGPLSSLVSRLKAWTNPPSKDLVGTLQGAVVETSDRRFVAETVFDLDGRPVPTIQAHPPAAIRRKINLPERARLRFSIAMHSSTYDKEGEGVEFAVDVDGEPVFERYLDPKHESADRGWHPVDVDLSPWGGQEVVLTLSTAPGPGGCLDFCTAGWGDLNLCGDLEKSTPSVSPPNLGERIVRFLARYASGWVTRFSPRAAAGIRHRQRYTREAFHNVDLFISPSRFLRSFFIRHGLDSEKILYLDNGFPPMGRVLDLSRPVHRPVRFAYIGTWIPSKGVDLLIRAFRDVDASKGILRIYGFFPGYDGYPEYEGLLYSLASGSSAIEFKGRYDSDRVCDVLAEVDVIVVPSIWWENSPLTVHEAFQAGIPLVTADVGGMAEFVPNGVCGLQFHHRDWRSLQEVVNRICNQPEILNELRKGIPPVLSMEQHVQCLLTLYEKALHSR